MGSFTNVLLKCYLLTISDYREGANSLCRYSQERIPKLHRPGKDSMFCLLISA